MLGKTTVGLFFLLLVWGNLVAGMKAGLGCPDWPLCHGRVVPPFGLEIYMEYMHRVIAATSTASLVALSYNRIRVYTGAAKAVPVGAVSLVMVAVVLGGMVVLMGLPMELTVFHFGTAICVFMLAFYMSVFDGVNRRPKFKASGPAAVFLAFIVVVAMQAVLGAYVRHSGSGLACPDFPGCMGRVIPSLTDGHVVAQFSHRLVAYLILLTTMALYAFMTTAGRRRPEKKLGVILILLTMVQVGLGAAVVLSGLQYVATALHMAVALSILMTLGLMWVSSIEESEALP